MRPSFVAGKLKGDVNSMCMQQPLDPVFRSGLLLNDAIAKTHEHPEFFLFKGGDVNAVQ